MKSAKRFFAPLFAALFISFSAYAGGTPTADTKYDELRTEIADIIKKVDLEDYNLEEDNVKIQFTINDNNEIIVLKTNNKKLDTVVKAYLNYKELKTTDADKNTLYAINVKLIS